jgi:DNA-binding MarR family transcriptional regulator
LSAATGLFSSRLKVAALRSLIADGPATRSTLGRRLGVRPSSLQDHLASLEDLGLVRPEPPASESGPVTRTYHPVPERVRALLDAVAAELTG